MSVSRAIGQGAPGRRWLVIVALVTVAGLAAGAGLSRPWAAEEPKPATAGAAGGAKAKQTPAQADAALQELMKARRPVKGVTARGQTIADAPPFTVTPRKDSIGKFPCTKCHDNTFVDQRVRTLKEEHSDLAFEHGGGRFWCYDACHDGRNIDSLVSLRGRSIEYDESYKLCGQCHFQRQKDWSFGGHGKRAGAWNEPREIPLTAAELLVTERDRIGVWRDARVRLNCTECHDAHSPSFKPFKPSPPPETRGGVKRRAVTREPEPKIWERLGDGRKPR